MLQQIILTRAWQLFHLIGGDLGLAAFYRIEEIFFLPKPHIVSTVSHQDKAWKLSISFSSRSACFVADRFLYTNVPIFRDCVHFSFFPLKKWRRRQKTSVSSAWICISEFPLWIAWFTLSGVRVSASSHWLWISLQSYTFPNLTTFADSHVRYRAPQLFNT